MDEITIFKYEFVDTALLYICLKALIGYLKFRPKD
jgi:hypothetical protein